jgi:hypothetical protein
MMKLMRNEMRAAEGGPLDGMRVPCRNPAGLLLINKPAGQAMVYELYLKPGMRGRKKLVTDGLVRELDDQRAMDTADADRFDVLAYDAEGMGPWPR